MKVSVKPIVFKNNNNLNLYGILHTPERANKEFAIIILSPGIKNRVGPHRLYLKMTKRFCDEVRKEFEIEKWDVRYFHRGIDSPVIVFRDPWLK